MDQRGKNMDTQIDMNELTIKEALAIDAARLVMRSKILTDPYMPLLPLTPRVIGKKIIKGIQKAANNVKQKDEL